MPTRMTERDWAVVLKVFRAACSRRGDKGRNDRKFLEAPHSFTVHNITWRDYLAGVAGAVRPREQCVEALLAAEPIRRPRSVLSDIGRDEPDGASGSDVRRHGGPGACLGSRRQGGRHGQALGRSRGGFSTRIRLRAEFDGLPPASHLTGARPGGAASDSRQFDILLDIGPDITPGRRRVVSQF
jgi:hypothetical protein